MTSVLERIQEAIRQATMLQGPNGQPLYLVVIGADALPGLGRPELETESVELFVREQVRDTSNHNPRAVLDLRDALHWGFEIENGCNQTVTVQLIGGNNRAPDAMGLVGASQTVSAATIEPLATDIWLPFLAIRVSYAIAPTSGALSIMGFVQRRKL